MSLKLVAIFLHLSVKIENSPLNNNNNSNINNNNKNNGNKGTGAVSVIVQSHVKNVFGILIKSFLTNQNSFCCHEQGCFTGQAHIYVI